MISFTSLTPKEAEKHRNVFGNYGITVSETWAHSHKAQKVMYIDKTGPVIEALATIFQIGHEDLKARIRFPDDAALQMAYTYKGMASAGVGASLWANLLQLYEYLEPTENAYQQEWRIVHPTGYRSSYTDSKDKILKSVSPPRGWAQILAVLRVESKDVLGFVCPADDEQRLRSILPKEFSGKRIVTVQSKTF